MAEFEFIDRYSVLGIPYPEPETMCLGQCEGTGMVPIAKTDMEDPWRALWLIAEIKKPSEDGWHFVACPECEGTGKRKAKEPRPTEEPET